MKKLFTITSILTMVILIAFACKKSSTTTTPSSSTSSTTGSTTSSTSSTSSTTGTTSTPTNTTTTNFTINGTSASNLHAPNGSAAGSQYLVFVYTTGSTYPEIDLTFLGTTAPATGAYTITNSTPTANQCGFSLLPAAGVTAIANSGVLHVVSATSPNNTAYFTNIVCTATTGTTTTTYTVTGALKY